MTHSLNLLTWMWHRSLTALTGIDFTLKAGDVVTGPGLRTPVEVVSVNLLVSLVAIRRTPGSRIIIWNAQGLTRVKAS